jgi:hypothetical protein
MLLDDIGRNLRSGAFLAQEAFELFAGDVLVSIDDI